MRKAHGNIGTSELERVMREHGDAVWRLAFAALSSREDAEDVYQQVFLQWYSFGRSGLPQADERRELLRITANCCFELKNYNKHREVEELTASLPSTEPGSDADMLLGAMVHLSKAMRTVLYLHYFEHYEPKEIARITGEKPTTVRSRLSRARAELRRELEGHGHVE